MPIRQDILDAAASVFNERGYDRASLEEIATIVGIKKGSLYYHIDSKEQLLFEIHEGMRETLLRNTQDAISSHEKASEQLKAVIHAILELVSARKNEVGVFVREYRALTGQYWKDVVKSRREYRQLIERLIQQGVADGEFRPLSAPLAALGILGMTNWVHEWYQSDGPMTSDEIADEFASLVIDGLAMPTS